MMAVVVTEPGGPEKLALQEVPDPQPGPGELLVRVRATALNRADLLQRRGLYPPPPGAPPYLGLEMAGEVLAAGPGVSGWQQGDRVFALLAGGGYAQKVVIPAAMALPMPPNLSFEEAAAIPEAFLTAYRNLFDLGRLRAGETVLIHAGASGVGTAAIQLARRAGARVFVTARTPEKLAGCRQLGAELAFDGREPGLVQRVLEATGGRGVDVILELVGASFWEEDLAMLAPGGRLLLVGLMGGSRASLDLQRVLQGNLQIIGSTLRSQSPALKADLSRRFWADCQEAFQRGELRAVVDSSFPLERVADAHRYMEANKNFGKVVLRVP
ncbi:MULTISPECIES: NAD(P)H-quinone oxidoreductase [Limnochorda]|uniref:NAD(P)H-quinone oxidoreductase n=1 Tax=Limnochorda TaxID=1676651 RepID=UPI0018133362|nr:NAD(P)H-quinone oxidoreductase [Limnochorda pilosa]MBO2485577.1 NADPH:quinone oxidoreductase [Bacillota bacterium]MBO2518624.1 NADPH:quinone oxidoreductase [Bacillota bacterium]NMA71204.1 NAD(P)H-quinone oxidoreductase [Bacillota bacterium]